MTISPATKSLLNELNQIGVVLRVAGNRLRYCPAGAVTPALRRRMFDHKGELLEVAREAHLYDVPKGWTPAAWADRLRYLAGLCMHPGRAAELREWAEGVEKRLD